MELLVRYGVLDGRCRGTARLLWRWRRAPLALLLNAIHTWQLESFRATALDAVGIDDVDERSLLARPLLHSIDVRDVSLGHLRTGHALRPEGEDPMSWLNSWDSRATSAMGACCSGVLIATCVPVCAGSERCLDATPPESDQYSPSVHRTVPQNGRQADRAE